MYCSLFYKKIYHIISYDMYICLAKSIISRNSLETVAIATCVFQQMQWNSVNLLGTMLNQTYQSSSESKSDDCGIRKHLIYVRIDIKEKRLFAWFWHIHVLVHIHIYACVLYCPELSFLLCCMEYFSSLLSPFLFVLSAFLFFPFVLFQCKIAYAVWHRQNVLLFPFSLCCTDFMLLFFLCVPLPFQFLKLHDGTTIPSFLSGSKPGLIC